MKVAFLNRDLPSTHANGVSCQVHMLANMLIKTGTDVTVFSLDPKPEDALYHVVQDPDPAGNGRIKRLFRPAVFFSRQDYSGFDLIHAHGDNYLLKTKKPVLRTFYGSALWEALYDSRPLYKLRQFLFYPLELAGGLRCNYSTGISKTTGRAVPMMDEVVPCGVDTEFFTPGVIKSERPSLIFVGNLSGRKRGWQLIEIFEKEIVSVRPAAELWLVTREPVPEKTFIRQFPGVSAEKLRELYQQAWVQCMPSRYEGFGVPLVEAMACGTPAVTTDPHSAPEFITHDKNGIICKLDQVGENINMLFTNEQKRDKYRRAGLEAVLHYTMDHVAKRYQEIYTGMLEKTYEPE